MGQTLNADIDGDGTVETVTLDGTRTTVSRNGTVLWDHDGSIDGWNRRASDRFQSADVNGDGRQEILVVNAPDLWTGLLQWDGSELRVMWASPPPFLQGSAGGWRRSSDDQFLPVDLDRDGADELVVSNGSDRWTGVLKWVNGSLGPVWMTPSPVSGPTGYWNRLPGDVFLENTGDKHLVDIHSPNETFGIFE